jgi:hypothetical protein
MLAAIRSWSQLVMLSRDVEANKKRHKEMLVKTFNRFTMQQVK